MKYARRKVDYVFGYGLYMSPSNLEMKVGTIKNYNNEIVLSTNDQELWWNKTANLPANATFYTDVSGTPTRKADPGPKIPLAAQGKPIMGGTWKAYDDTHRETGTEGI